MSNRRQPWTPRPDAPRIPPRMSPEALAKATAIAQRIATEGGSAEAWDAADESSTISAAVHNMVADITGGGPSCYVTSAHQLEQFRRWGDEGKARGGKVWTRAAVAL